MVIKLPGRVLNTQDITSTTNSDLNPWTYSKKSPFSAFRISPPANECRSSINVPNSDGISPGKLSPKTQGASTLAINSLKSQRQTCSKSSMICLCRSRSIADILFFMGCISINWVKRHACFCCMIRRLRARVTALANWSIVMALPLADSRASRQTCTT